jgi:hypothetical protein
MTIVYVISIKNFISSPELFDATDVRSFFADEISKIIIEHIVIDFSKIESISHSFALQYLAIKNEFKGKKIIKEINLSENVCKIILKAQKDIDNSNKKDKNRTKILSNVKITDPVVLGYPVSKL